MQLTLTDGEHIYEFVPEEEVESDHDDYEKVTLGVLYQRRAKDEKAGN